jgi:tetratricopeptide (TPR) repeat protein
MSLFFTESKPRNLFIVSGAHAIVALLLILSSPVFPQTHDASRSSNNSRTAIDEYALGRTLYLRLTIDSIAVGVDHLLNVVENDPEHLRAWGTLSDAYRTGALMLKNNTDEWKQKSQDTAEHILLIAPDTGGATRLIGRNYIDEGDWKEAERVLKRPQTLESDSQRSKGLDIRYGTFLLSVGRVRESEHYLERARETDYLAAVIYSRLGKVYAAMNDYDRSFETIDQGRALFKEWPERARWHPLLRKTALFVALATDNQQLIEARAKEILIADMGAGEIDAQIWALSANKLALGNTLRRLWLEPTNQYGFRAETIAYWAAYAGDYEQTYDALSKLPNDLATMAFWQPVMKEFRKQASFKHLLLERRIVDYWRETGSWGDFCRPVGEDDFECGAYQP